MKKIIFTDLDGTLTLRDSYHVFIFHNLTIGLVFKNAFGLLLMGVKYLTGLLSKEGVKRSSFEMFFTGYDVNKELQSFVEKISWNEKVINLVNAKKEEGYKVILVSASPDIYMPAIVQHLKYDGFLATKTLRNGEKLEGHFDGKVCNFDEKKRRILEYLGDERATHTISYGNSSGDFEMLSYCDDSYFVTKSKVEHFKD